MDEVLTLEGLHDIDGDLEARKATSSKHFVLRYGLYVCVLVSASLKYTIKKQFYKMKATMCAVYLSGQHVYELDQNAKSLSSCW